jgi:hypothetical protein
MRNSREGAAEKLLSRKKYEIKESMRRRGGEAE